MDEDHSDKENCAPSTTETPFPPLPLNPKGNIFQKQVANETHYEHVKSSSNIARKRQKLGALTTSPPRASYASQMSKIFAARPSAKKHVENEAATPPGIPEDAMKVFNHFKQALRCETATRPEEMRGDDNASSDSSVSGGDSSGDDAPEMRNSSGQSTIPLLQRGPSTMEIDSDPFADPTSQASASNTSEGEPALPDHTSPSPTRTRPKPPPSPLPTTALEHAIHASFPPTPSRQERRKTLNIDLRNTPPPPPASTKSSSSTESWTGDEVFFPRENHHQLVSPVAVSAPRSPWGSPGLSTTAPPSPSSPLASPWIPSSRPSPPLLSPLRAVRPKNRFHVPAVRSPMGQGVPLCMESHPEREGGGSDADDEDDGDGSGKGEV
ncbi:hypothetical protein PRZ48_013642 [Zasmidium cellare]|uniref:Uncharacterized protein n=1 Tax=Zasmidium cellare TaxID=395010 RepID=A0ABR0E281_ZASCE|nr:hypothetical protein PRZ48_013642 [Zasmidium cellare]